MKFNTYIFTVLILWGINIMEIYSRQLHPYYIINTKSLNPVEDSYRLIKKIDEKQWLELVPTQAPRRFQLSPSCPSNNEWKWSEDNPNIIYCAKTGDAFPDNPNFKEKVLSVKVMSGKTVEVPYYEFDGNISYIRAQIDYMKTKYMRDKLQLLSVAYEKTKDERFARYVALALDKWSLYVPDYFMTEGWNLPKIVDADDLERYKTDPEFVQRFVQRASELNGLTNELNESVILALDAVWDSKSMDELSKQRGYNVREHIINDFFINITDWLIEQPSVENHASTNLVTHIGAMILVAGLVEEAQSEKIIGFIDKYFDTVLKRNFTRDGMYPESIGYHIQYAEMNIKNVNRLDDYFKLCPPETDTMKRYYNSHLNRRKVFLKAIENAHNISFPDGDLAPFDDTHAGLSVEREKSESFLLPTYKHVMLADGTGENQVQVNIGAHEYCNHITHGLMGMTMFAFGNELLGDIRYSRIPGREYTRSTVAHNTVIVNMKNQQYRSNKQAFGNVGHVFNSGFISCFEPNVDGVSLMEMYNDNIDPENVKRYQRLQILNTQDIKNPYLIDIFVVESKNNSDIHDYILHGSTQFDQIISNRNLYGSKLEGDYPLLPDGCTYKDPVSMSSQTNWYGVFRDVDSVKVGEKWNLTFKAVENDKPNLDIRSVGEGTLFTAKSPVSYRRNVGKSLFSWWRPAIIERSRGKKTVFVHLITPFQTKTPISDFSNIKLKGNSDEHIGLEIKFINGRKDVILINLNDLLITGQSCSEGLTSEDGRYYLEGKVGIFSSFNGKNKGYLLKGNCLKYDKKVISNKDAFINGTVINIERCADGFDSNAFVIKKENIDNLERFKGNWVRLTFGDYVVKSPKSEIKIQRNMNELYKVDKICVDKDVMRIYCADDPMLRMENDSVIEIMRPQRVFEGNKIRFDISSNKVGYFN